MIDAERQFLESQRIAHLATADAAGVPHVVPVCYALAGNSVYITIDDKPQVLEVDTIIVCAGQLPLRTLYDELQGSGLNVSLVGGAYEAGELDAKRAINQASYLAAAV